MIELTEQEEKILNGVFEHFSHIDEATKKRVIKSCFILDIFAAMVLPQKVSRNDIDISTKRIKSNMNSHLTFEQFVGVLEDITVRNIGFETLAQFIETRLTKYISSLHD